MALSSWRLARGASARVPGRCRACLGDPVAAGLVAPLPLLTLQFLQELLVGLVTADSGGEPDTVLGPLGSAHIANQRRPLYYP
jgi:hypothetical protein